VKRFAAPAAFLLAATIAVLLVRSGLQHRETTSTAPTVPPPASRRVVTTAPTRTTTVKPPVRGARFYTVVAGDTFGVISSKTGVAVARIQRLNPNVRSTALFVGQRLKIR